MRLEKRMDGVWYGLGPGPWPRQLELDGRTYYRFHDFIYVDRRLEELTAQQVVAVCELRTDYSTGAQLDTNRAIQQFFVGLVNAVAPQSLLEIGPGTRPIFEPTGAVPRYELAELDERIVPKLIERGYSAQTFASETALQRIESNTIDMVVAVFVLHFPIAELQAREIHRILAGEGLMIANVYRRSANARRQLRKLFSSQNLEIEVIKRSDGVGYDHEYWVLGRDLNVPKCARTIHLIRRPERAAT